MSFLVLRLLDIVVVVCFLGCMARPKQKTLRELREGKGLTLDGVALAAGVDRSTLSRLERGMSPLKNHSKRVALAKALDISEDNLSKAILYTHEQRVALLSEAAKKATA